MNYKCSIFIFVSIVLALCQAYQFYIPADKSHPGVCIFSGNILPKGDNSMPSTCQNLNCRDDGSILVQGCGKFVLPNCQTGDYVDLTRPYPECCKLNFICTDSEGKQYNKEFSPY